MTDVDTYSLYHQVTERPGDTARQAGSTVILQKNENNEIIWKPFLTQLAVMSVQLLWPLIRTFSRVQLSVW